MRWRAAALVLLGCGALSAADTEPAVITIQVKDAPAKRVVAELAKQSGAAIPTSPPALLDGPTAPKVTLELERQPFWVAVRELGRAAGIGPTPAGDDPYPRMLLGLGAGFWDEPHAISGPVVVFVTDVFRTSTVELWRKGHTVERGLQLELAGFVQPGLKVVSVFPDVEVREAVDENGVALKPAKPQAEEGDEVDVNESGFAEQPGTRVWTWGMSLGLELPEKVGQKVAKLRGVSRIRVATKVSPVQVGDALKVRGVRRSVGGAGFVFRNMIKADIEYVARISLRKEKASDREWELLSHSVYNGMVSLYDAQGRLVAGRCTENGGEYGSQKVDATLRFVREPGVSDPAAGEPHKLVWEAVVEGKEVGVEFELLDLPIPK